MHDEVGNDVSSGPSLGTMILILQKRSDHEAFPFVEATAKAKLAGSIETQPGHHLAALSAG